MAIIEIAQIKIRTGVESDVPRLASGEFGWAQDTEHLYLGKRIVDGAVNNNNSRILTEVDLDNIFSLLGAASTTTLVAIYNYRDGILPDSKPRLLQSKLDDLVSLSDFGVVAGAVDTDITLSLAAAINDIFGNLALSPLQQQDARRNLLIPAGNYVVSSNIELPPFTSLSGAGSGLTTITLVGSNVSMFSTIDANGIGRHMKLANPGDSTDIAMTGGLTAMSTGEDRARNVRINGMTLAYSTLTTYSTETSLISLDNVLDAHISDIKFKSVTTGTTYGLGASGIGISMSGTGGGLGSGDVNLCENIQVIDCTFDSLYQGISSTGTVIRPLINNNIFSNLQQGIFFGPGDEVSGPSNGVIDSNRFENIVDEALFVADQHSNSPPADARLSAYQYVTDQYSDSRSNHITSHNFFIQVANGTGLDDYVTSSTKSVIVFETQGNKSVDNYFHRQTVANNSTDGSFYFNPLITGSTTIDDSATQVITVSADTGNVQVMKIALTGLDQTIIINYQLSNAGLSRKGELVVNIAPDGYSNITDTYNFIEDTAIFSSEITFNTSDQFALDKNYVILNCNNGSVDMDAVLEFQTNIML